MEIKLIKSEENGTRIDKFLTNYFKEDINLSRSLIQKYINDSLVEVNDEVVTSSYILKVDDLISVSIPDAIASDLKPEDIDFEIVYEDKDLVVVNKPNDLVVHPAPGNESGTLVNGLLHKIKFLSSISGVLRPGIVHRLDKKTTGLMVVAKSDEAHKKLVDMFKENKIDKTYVGIVHGVIKENGGKIDMPIGRSSKDRKKMAVTDKNSRHAITNFTVLDRFDKSSYVEFKIETGRTHQIRVHMSEIGFPILGDPLYATRKDAEDDFGQYLHSYSLEFIHPVTNKKMFFKCEPPKKILDKIKELKEEVL